MKAMLVRLPVELVGRLETLQAAVADDDGLKAFRMSQNSVLKMVLLEGLHVLEKRYQLAKE